MSTAEAEYRAIDAALQYGILFKRMLNNIQFLKQPLLVKELTDNRPDIDMIYSLGGTKMSKFFDVRHKFMQDQIKQHNVVYSHIPSTRMKAYICTKPLSRRKFKALQGMLRFQDFSQSVNGAACGITDHPKCCMPHIFSHIDVGASQTIRGSPQWVFI